MSEINWTIISSGFPLPTYGNYGGKGWTGGKFGGEFTVAPKNALDAIFRDHDLAYSTAGDNFVLRYQADLRMQSSINQLLSSPDSTSLGIADRIYGIYILE